VFIHRTRPGTSGGATLGGLPAYGLPTPGEGVKVGEHGTGPEVDPDRQTEPDPAGIERLKRYVERWLPGLDPSPRSVETCLYTTTPDEHFVVGRSGRIVVGSPCSGHGFKFAPVVGRMLSELALGRGNPAPTAWASVAGAPIP
jgi:sarcosine oxidase